MTEVNSFTTFEFWGVKQNIFLLHFLHPYSQMFSASYKLKIKEKIFDARDLSLISSFWNFKIT